MSYQSEVLADSPVLYWRLDVSGFGTNGESVPDISGNDLHGTLTFNGSQQCWGLASPIETDSASREFLGYTNASFFGITGESKISRASDSLMTVTNDCSIESWLRPMAQLPAAGLFPMVQKTNTMGILLTNTGGNDRIAGYCIDSVGTVFTVTDTSIATTAYLGESFHVVVVRLGNSLSIYRNGVLKNTTTITSGLPTQFTSGTFNVQPATGYYTHARHDEVAFYTYALSGSRILAHYEAAKAVLPLRATITIRVNVELNTDQISPENLGFPHNFSDTFGDGQIPIVEELQYKTNVNQSEPDYQQRVNARPHGAFRSFEYHLSPTGTGSRSRLHGSLYTPAETYCVPLWRDSGITTGSASSGTNIIPCDTIKRRYEVGSYCGATTNLQSPSSYQFFKISAVADGQVTLTTNIGTTIPSGSPVFPAFLATLSEDSLAVKSFAADHEDMILRFDALETELFTRDTTAYTPSTTYKSIEVFTLESAKVSFLDSRPYDISRRIQARGRDYQYARDTGSPQTFPVRFLLTTRAALSEFYGWLDARQGKSLPLWVSSKERDLIITAKSLNAYTVSPATGFSFHPARRDIEILKTDGTFGRVRVATVTDNGNNTETWNFEAEPPLLADVARASFLKYCVLAQDSVQIRYFKGGANGSVIGECSLSFRELLTSPT